MSLRPLRPHDADASEASVDLAPLIDVVFLLLIFYVVAATFTQPTAVPINRPTATQAASLPERPVVITLTPDGEAWLGNQLWQQDDMVAVQQALSERSGGRVLLQADGEVPTKTLVQVIDTCRAAGASSVDLAADRAAGQ